MTLRELLETGRIILQGRGLAGPAREAELLLAHLLEKDRIYLYVQGREPAGEDLCRRFFELLDRRTAGYPLQYLLGSTDFMGIPLQVEPGVLIPRPETELLAEKALEDLRRRPRLLGKHRVLDLCTGSGALAIALACLADSVQVTATDLSPAALELARSNAASAGCGARITFLQGDLFAPLPPRATFDLILTNPPYIPSHVIPTLAPEVKDHEPLEALDGGEDGLAVIRPILEEAPLRLNPGGLLLMEIGWDQGPAVLALLKGSSRPYRSARILKDLAGLDRILRLRR